MSEVWKLSRRSFLRAGLTASGLVLGIGACGPDAPARKGPRRVLGAWIRIAPDGAVELALDKAEMGQGIHTALGMIVAEELAVPWERVAVTTAVLEGPERSFSTGASTSVRFSWLPLARAAASAREMLVAAAAEHWGVAPDTCQAKDAAVLHPETGRRIEYGELAESAAQLPVPETPGVRPHETRRIVGRSLPRVDIPAKVNGSAVFGIDVRLPGLLYAAVAMPPAMGGTIAGFDRAAARSEPGVVSVVVLEAPAPVGVAVVAERFWQAQRALESAGPRFEAPGDPFDGESYTDRLDAGLARAGAVAVARGDALQALESGAPGYSARYRVPFLAHMTMEPQNCTAHVKGGACEIWAPTQSAGRMRTRVAEMLGIRPEAVRIHTTLLGGGFGRRYEPDVALQAVQLSRAVGRPVQVLWTREQDVRHDFYRPAFAAELRAALDPSGLPTAWHQRIAGPWYEARDAAPWLRRSVARLAAASAARLVPEALPDALEYRFPRWMRSAVSPLATKGAGPLPYEVPAARVEYTPVDCPVPVGYWRSVGHSQNAFFVESFIDELGHRAGMDALAYRRSLLRGTPRVRAVLDRAAEAAGWHTPPAPGRARGLALHPSFGSIVAQVVEVEGDGDGGARVVRVVCAVDCGEIVHPGGVVAQIEGGVVFGLSTLESAITFRAGAAEQSNFHDFPIATFDDTPEIEVHLVASGEAPGGVGELATPPVAPAVANALFAATGTRVRTLPLGPGLTPNPGDGRTPA